MAIYTKTGDKGETSLANGQRVSKADARLEAYGTIDELNSFIGWLRVACASSQQKTDAQLKWVQDKLFNLGALLSCADGEWILDADVKQLEAWIDEMQAEVPKQKSFILPSGTEASCRAQIARTVCRRAERKMIGIDIPETSMRFVNRLSDYLFVLSRYLNFAAGQKEENWTA